jgi:hypothetical protein
MVALTRLAAGTEVCLLLSHCWRDRNTYHLLVNLLVYLLVNLLVNVCRQLKVTDNGWNGIGFRTGEGVLRFTADRMIPPGSTWGYDGVSMDTVYGTWDKLSVSYIQSTEVGVWCMSYAEHQYLASLRYKCRSAINYASPLV